jgi:hypothetical protein
VVLKNKSDEERTSSSGCSLLPLSGRIKTEECVSAPLQDSSVRWFYSSLHPVSRIERKDLKIFL